MQPWCRLFIFRLVFYFRILLGTRVCCSCIIIDFCWSQSLFSATIQKLIERVMGDAYFLRWPEKNITALCRKEYGCW